MSYNPKEYWEERGKDYIVAVDTSAEFRNLKNLILQYKPKSILDVGSGYGRLYQYLYREGMIEKIPFKMCDFVDSFRYACFEKTGILPDLWDGEKLGYHDNQFDFVISFSVFLHVTPSCIEKLWSEHIRVCKKYLYLASYYGPNKELAQHCFRHDYDALIEKYGLVVVDKKIFMDGLRINLLLLKNE